MTNRTVLTIAHRLSTIKTAHHIAVIDRGNIAEMGSYGDLIAIQDGIFRKLVERQTIVSWWGCQRLLNGQTVFYIRLFFHVLLFVACVSQLMIYSSVFLWINLYLVMGCTGMYFFAIDVNDAVTVCVCVCVLIVYSHCSRLAALLWTDLKESGLNQADHMCSYGLELFPVYMFMINVCPTSILFILQEETL